MVRRVPADDVDAGAILGRLTLDEKVALLSGSDLWHTVALPDRGVPALRVTDGPNGARGTSWDGLAAACVPCGSALGATWDTGLVEEVGVTLGREARSKGARVLLGPVLNLHRTPVGGRNFEAFSEDPHLAARIGVAYIRGVQSQRVAACAKHFVANDTEFERMTISSEVDERTLREVYLLPFEHAVRDADVRTVMAAYNKVGGTHATEHAPLLTDVLRDEWGFDGLVMSDWGATHSAGAALVAGMDLEMPGPPRARGRRLVERVQAGEVPESAVDAAAIRVLELAAWSGAFADGAPGAESTLDDAPTRALIRRVGAEASVLLKNDGGLLPLDARSSVAVIGPNAAPGQVQGGGSAGVRPGPVVSPLAGIRERRPTAPWEQGCITHTLLPPVAAPQVGAPGLVAEYLDAAGEVMSGHPMSRGVLFRFAPSARDVTPPVAVRVRGRFRPDEAGRWTLGLVTSGPGRLVLDGEVVIDNASPEPGDAFFGFGSAEVRIERELDPDLDHELVVEMELVAGLGIGALRVGCMPPVPDDLIGAAVTAAATADVAVVVVGTNDDWETEGHDRSSLELPGLQSELIRRVAAVNPRTVVVVNAGSAVATDWAEAVPAVLQVWFAGEELGHSLADVLFGDVEPGGRLPLTVPRRLEDTPAYLVHPGDGGVARYAEGVFVGHRWYDARRIPPAFALGHGLGYTTWAIGDARVVGSLAGGDLAVEVPVTNTGRRAGRHVVQCYVSPPPGPWRRPDRELRAFTKVSAEPGDTVTARLELDERAFACWDATAHGWTTPGGDYELLVGSSSVAIATLATVVR